MNVCFDRFEYAFSWDRKNVLSGSYELKLSYYSTRREDDDFACRGGGGSFVKLTIDYDKCGGGKRKKVGKLDDSGNGDNDMLAKFGDSDNDDNEDDKMDSMDPREKVRVIDMDRNSHLTASAARNTLYMWDA